jgi:primase-polymerase (primpol)-like protein
MHMTDGQVKDVSTSEATPPRPQALAVLPDGIPDDLLDGRQHVVWRYELREGKWTKPPSRPDGSPASVTDPATWSTAQEVLDAYAAGGWDGVGRVLVRDDGIVGFDLDGVRDRRLAR